MALLASVILAGCGGGPTAPSRPLTHARYQEALDRISTESERRNPQTASGALDNIDRIARQLAALHPPADATDAQQRFLAGLRAIRAKLARFLPRALAGDLSAQQELQQAIFSDRSALLNSRTARREYAASGYHFGNVTPGPPGGGVPGSP